MKVLTYFSFTLLSIFIQFSVMDLLLDNGSKGVDLNLSTPKTQLNDIIKDLGYIPHALYYHSSNNNGMDKNGGNKRTYRNTSSSSEKQQPSTATTSTIFDIFFNENTSVTESVFTTDFEYTSIGFDNVTEVTLFDYKNDTNKLDKNPPIKYDMDCNCNLLYEVCDINCCCDYDCGNSLKKMFNCMDSHNQTKSKQISGFCVSHLLHSGKSRGNILNDMFCIVKTNLPEYRNIIKTNHINIAENQYLKWRQSEKPKYLKEFSKMQYKIGDPVWQLRNASINHMNLPTSTVNNYCAGRKPITFMQDEVSKCIVKYRNLEMFHILKTAEHSAVITATNVTANSTVLNCTNLHCTNLTIIICDGKLCVFYNKTLHEPVCSEHSCTNIALTVDYLFYYYNSRIANVSVILHIRNVTTASMFMSQQINVKFLVGNKTDEQRIVFSGSPGYKRGLVLVVSSSDSNYTNNFYQSKLTKEKYLSLPINVNGECVLPNSKQDFIHFGINKRMKCRYYHNYSLPYNNINVCKDIQGNISELFRLDNKTVISPYGNPYDLNDEDWIRLNLDSAYKQTVDGIFDTSLHCYNVISQISLAFVFTNVNDVDNNTILSLKVKISTSNISFTTLEEISMIVTTDISFVNVSKRPILKYAGSPHLNINIPRNFFFSYPSNSSNRNINFTLNVFLYSVVLTLVFCCK